MCFDLSDIPRPPQTTGTRALGNCPCHTRSFRLALFQLHGMFALARPLPDVILCAGCAAQGAWPFRCARALGPPSTGLAALLSKADVDPRRARLVLAIGPDATALALGARHPGL